ncbi:hypothetical protein J7E96_24965 [Streptomyces sp. ISL-96]|nr:hypothetical protein [Streptomyces sp. ISL-96]
MPEFAPLRVRGGRHRLRRAVRRRRRAMAAGLAMTAAALAASGARDAGRTGGAAQARAQAQAREHALSRADSGAAARRERRPVEMVSAPVRIADAGTVRLLRRGDRVDVIAAAADASVAGGEPPAARVVAVGARVVEVPKAPEAHEAAGAEGGGALVVLSVPRTTAAALAGVGTTSQLAVTLC